MKEDFVKIVAAKSNLGNGDNTVVGYIHSNGRVNRLAMKFDSVETTDLMVDRLLPTVDKWVANEGIIARAGGFRTGLLVGIGITIVGATIAAIIIRDKYIKKITKELENV